MDHAAVHLREPHVTTAVAAGQECMIKAQQMEHSRPQVVDLARAFNRAVAALLYGDLTVW